MSFFGVFGFCFDFFGGRPLGVGILVPLLGLLGYFGDLLPLLGTFKLWVFKDSGFGACAFKEV